ncbi:glycoside hydrolase family 97 protein [Paenibacillus harenae]|uniref:glycoside hydrolase family 97 protein n=1 Tax=Paenibacillus harenae TaxID=306543 RepID=UPI0004218CBA|nr:glycoside hydrolase family 97 protein [Paenibacillus harenae]
MTLHVETGTQTCWMLESLDSRIRFEVTLNREGKLFYEVKRNEKSFLKRSPLGIETDYESFVDGLSFRSAMTGKVDETYTLPHGKQSLYFNQANELTLVFDKNGHELQLVCRVYNEGVAFRYRLPAAREHKVNAEPTGFVLPQDKLVNIWASKFMECYERTYELCMPEMMNEAAYAMPMLFQVGTDGWMLLTEGAVYGDYCASHLIVNRARKRTFDLAFASDQEGPNSANGPFATPWRAAIIGGELASIVESTMIFHLNPPTEVEDLSWVKPGRSCWSWHPDSDSPKDHEKQVEFVDFASDMGWEYSIVDGGWDSEASTVNAQELIRYAETKGVGIWLWSHYKALAEEEEARRKMALWAEWGARGIKVDFFDSDSQERIKAYDRIARIAMEYKLMINYHGATKPSGEQRRWPHVLTREGIFGAEYWKNPLAEGPNAAHNCTVPFTRNVVGSMDYTPVTFSRLTRTGHGHQLALSVIFESGMQCFADSIEAYEESAGNRFLRQVPAAWDQTILLEGYPGRFVTMARRSGQDWYVGSICAAGGRTAHVPLHFLDSDAVYEAEIYEEVITANDHYRFMHSTDMNMRTESVTNRDRLDFLLKINGGCVIRLTKKTI